MREDVKMLFESDISDLTSYNLPLLLHNIAYGC